jgi:hypothetical protein
LLLAPRAKTDGIFKATLSGSNEIPPNASTASGSVGLQLFTDTLYVLATFGGLTGDATGAGIHCCAGAAANAGVAVPFVGFQEQTFATYKFGFDLMQSSVYTASFETANGGTATSAESTLLAAMIAGEAYVSIDDALFPGGEIRGQLALVTTPESSTLMFMGIGLIGLVAQRRRRTSPKGRSGQAGSGGNESCCLPLADPHGHETAKFRPSCSSLLASIPD